MPSKQCKQMNITTYIQNYKDRLEDLPSLMLTLSDLMQEGYQLSESFTMLLPYYTKNPEKWQEIINDSLQNGFS